MTVAATNTLPRPLLATWTAVVLRAGWTKGRMIVEATVIGSKTIIRPLVST
jgi:hypothetical protein